MKVILSRHVPNLGEMGQTVNVSDGYARNYLIPRKLAVAIDSASAGQIQHELRMIKKREERVRAQLQEVAKKIEAQTLEFRMRAGEDEKLFGSVTSAHIAERLQEMGYEVDRKGIRLNEPIKHLGIFLVPVKLGSGVEANVRVWVTPEHEEEADAGTTDAESKPEEHKN